MAVKPEKQFKVLAYVIGVLILITAMLSIYFVIYPYLTNTFAPQIILDILLVMNLLIPTVGIASMIAFICYKNSKN